MNMIEKVARAICSAEGGNMDGYLIYVPVAKAAIEAMREPSKVMLEAIDDSYSWDSSDVNGSWFISSADPKTNWQAGIDAALKEE